MLTSNSQSAVSYHAWRLFINHRSVPAAGAGKCLTDSSLREEEKEPVFSVFPSASGWDGIPSGWGRGSGQDDSFHGGAEGLITELLQGMLQEALRYHSARRLFRNAA